VAGWAASNERVSEFLRNLTNNGRYVERPELIEIKLAGQSPDGIQRRLFDFSMNFYMKPSSELGSPSVAAGTPGAPAAAGAPGKKG
jgi:type IV pilus assembly protein PilN